MIDFTTLTIVDYFIVFALFISAVFSTLRGMTREFLGLLGWVVSVVVANYAKPLLEDPIANLINTDGLSAALAWGLPFAATVIIWFLLASLFLPGLLALGLAVLTVGLASSLDWPVAICWCFLPLSGLCLP